LPARDRWTNLDFLQYVAVRWRDVTETVQGTSTTTSYHYDGSDQLTGAGSVRYTYDANGNRTQGGYQVGPGNEVLSDGVWNYKYDLAGNLVEKDGIGTGLVWQYTWDNANHLLSAVEYDSQDQVVVREVNVHAADLPNC
jgi:hypothetical protein